MSINTESKVDCDGLLTDTDLHKSILRACYYLPMRRLDRDANYRLNGDLWLPTKNFDWLPEKASKLNKKIKPYASSVLGITKLWQIFVMSMFNREKLTEDKSKELFHCKPFGIKIVNDGYKRTCKHPLCPHCYARGLLKILSKSFSDNSLDQFAVGYSSFFAPILVTLSENEFTPAYEQLKDMMNAKYNNLRSSWNRGFFSDIILIRYMDADDMYTTDNQCGFFTKIVLLGHAKTPNENLVKLSSLEKILSGPMWFLQPGKADTDIEMYMKPEWFDYLSNHKQVKFTRRDVEKQNDEENQNSEEEIDFTREVLINADDGGGGLFTVPSIPDTSTYTRSLN